MNKELCELANILLQRRALKFTDRGIFLNASSLNRSDWISVAESLWGVVLKKNPPFEAIGGFGRFGENVVKILVKEIVPKPLGFQVYNSPNQIKNHASVLLFAGFPILYAVSKSLIIELFSEKVKNCEDEGFCIAGMVAPYWPKELSGPGIPPIYTLFNLKKLNKYARSVC
ncbi:MAG: hypothetical protein UV36_C0025G0005 [Parcubacteria group bacterium GW2011_GWC2_42_6]|nr:MAG: hypothetical protein UU87_C0004G0042 [Parcubacteria group bacterium GW2011_GWA2_42_11]KKS66436.1 MAG: hypothetical protein UV36_C0025G0005 [Parcubacteria group bacterium GW2011_GWC2_42_6]